MILETEIPVSGPTLDELFRRAGVRAPETLALCDPPNRESFTDGAPRNLSYADADRAISALAARLHALGLTTDAVIAIQLPNIVESVIALLAVLRAGMIAAPMPLLWRQQEIAAALRGIGAKAIIACGRAGSERPARSAMLAAAELFPIRQVCAFGSDLPDGVVPLDDIFTRWDDLVHATVRPGSAAAHVASVTFDVTAAGIIPIARNAAQLIAGGRAVVLESEIAQGAAILSTIPASSFAGSALGVVPWLLSGGTLALHHGCDLETLDAQSQTFPGAALMMPGPALAPLAEAGRLLAFKTIAALWRAPEQMAACAPWYQQAALIDVAAFGEIGVIAGRRQANGKPAPLPLGAIGTGIETARTRAGTLALRGPMVPTRAFPSGQALSRDVFLDTGFTCVRDGEHLAITGPPAGIATVGGYRFAQVDAALGAALADIDAAATVMALPDALLGQRLAGNGADPQAIVAALQAQGANPLITGAFGRHAG